MRRISSRTFCLRLLYIVGFAVIVLLIQMLALSRIHPTSQYPWDENRSLEKKSDITDPGIGHEHPPLSDSADVAETVKQVSLSHGGNSSPKPTVTNSSQGISGSLDHHSSVEKPAVLPKEFCTIKAQDALSAIQRAKTEECRNMIRNVTCLAQNDKLYNSQIRNVCPIGSNPGQTFQAVSYDKGQGSLPRVVFLLSMHGRAFRQVRRLFKAIYHEDHYFILHIDSRSDYLFRMTSDMVTGLPNVYIPTWRMATIWGGASLLQMLLRVLEDLEYILTDWKWEYFINLSESDFPIKHNDELVQFLRVHRGKNFVKTHGGDINKFIQKQGLDRTFVECENHMWRVGNRPLPKDIVIDGGSDWIAINRNYSHYLVTNKDLYLTELKRYYQYSLLPAESFFHTVLRNGPLCETFVRTNLRVTNWNRKLGCRCQYKHIVDWCGCSPNDFLSKDLNKLKSAGDQNFFARKFEAIVNQEVINSLAAHLYGEYPADTPGLTSYWESLYHVLDDPKPSSALFTIFNSFVRLSQRLILKEGNRNRDRSACFILASPVVKEVSVYHDEDKFVGLIVSYQNISDIGKTEGPVIEALLRPVPFVEFFPSSSSSEAGSRIHQIEVGSVWDGKESIFRNYGGILGVHDEIVVAMRMRTGHLCHVDVAWVNPVGNIAVQEKIKLEPSWTVSFHKPKIERPLMPGIWKVKFIDINKKTPLVEATFLVTPLMYDKKTPLWDPASVNGKRVSAAQPGMDVHKYIEWKANVHKTGEALEGWIDSLVERFWSLDFPSAICMSTASPQDCGEEIPACESTDWSTLSPDPKSELGPVQPSGRIS